MKLIKFILGLVLLLPCVALTQTLYQTASGLSLGYGPWLERPVFWFGLGFGCWLLIFGLLSPSTRTYIIGHELTHAFWAVLMGARVSNLKAGAASGQVTVSKENWLITLSPYFFPLYTLVILVIYFGLGFLTDMKPLAPLFYYLVGFSWSFHFVFTGLILRQSQPDIRRHGWLFSMTIIYGMNLLVIALLLALLFSTHVSFTKMGQRFGGNCVECANSINHWVRELPVLWQRVIESVK